MSFSNFIDLCSDEETEGVVVEDVKPVLSSSLEVKRGDMIAVDVLKLEDRRIKQEFEESRSSNSGSSVTDQGSSSASGFGPTSGSPDSPVPLCRQFWKSGDYEPGQAATVSQNGRNCLRIHPKFLHSNATSHKWAFGAIAELVDNAVDEVQNGATFVIIDKFTIPRNGNPALLVQDDGGGMDPESLRRCMSFGFSDKQTGSTIGQYGNGFKTSTMRLGADVIVFSRAVKKRISTQSIGLLSYTFLRQTGCDDIIVPTVDYEIDPLTGSTGRLFRHGPKQFSSNLMMLLKWSPFASEAELLEQFNDIGRHGTKIFLFNLWHSDDGTMELDFESDLKDIMISAAHKSVQTNSLDKMLTQKNIASRLHYSLRAYISVLYLRIPDNFRIILRGEVVEPHYIVNDLIYRECVMYRPQVGGVTEAAVVTTIGFLAGAPNVNVHGFNIYHKNRLILPFLRVATNSYGKGRGVVGILEANFIKPTHDKQDFEKSTLYQKLENRLKEMTYEYWDLHCHLVGYNNKKKRTLPIPQMPQLTTASCGQQDKMKCSSTELSQASFTTNISACSLVTAIGAPTNSSPGQFTASNVDSHTRLPAKRKQESHIAGTDASKQTLSEVAGHRSSPMTQLCRGAKQKQFNEMKTMTLENKKLHEQCLQYEEIEKQLILKAQQLQSELQEAQQVYNKLLIEFKSMGEVKTEKQ